VLFAKHVTRQLLILLPCCGLLFSQTTQTKGVILQPSGDANLTNIIVGSSVTPAGTFGYTAEVYLVKSDGSAPPRKLTNFDESNHAPGATFVAISSDGTRAAYVGLLDTNGVRHEEVHAIDIASGNDRLITTNQTSCGTPSCFGAITFSQDGTKLLWNFVVPNLNGSIYSANFDGTGLTEPVVARGGISGPNNVTSANGRFIFLSTSCGMFCESLETANLDGSGATVLQSKTNTPLDGYFASDVISANGAVIAYIDQIPGFVGGLGSNYPAPSTGTCNFLPYNFFFGGMTISADGTHAAGISNTQIFNCENAVKPFTWLTPLDVELSGDGTRMIYSTAAGGSARSAIWISDASGANATLVFGPHSINSGGIIGLGSTAKDLLPLSQGSYFSIYGNNFSGADALTPAPGLHLPLSLAGISVSVNGVAVPVEAVTPAQINAQLPQEMATGNATVTVQFADGTVLTQAAVVTRSAPAIILIPSQFTTKLQAAVFHAGTGVLADQAHPASAGEVVETYGFGLGPTIPDVPVGTAAPFNPPAQAYFAAESIDGAQMQTAFAGLVPGLAGVYQMNVVIPAGLAAGSHIIQWFSADPAGPAGYFYSK
jgi:uncharacterized protein (TIGR03437 family)